MSGFAEIQAGGDALTQAVTAQLASLLAGGNVTSETESAAASAISSAAVNLGSILTAAHGSSATATDLAVAGGLEAIEQLPAVAAAVVNAQEGVEPSTTTLANDLAAMQAANKALDAIKAGS